MFVSFLMPHIDRGLGPLFEWVMLLQAARFRPDELVFIGDERYFAPDRAWGTQVEAFGFQFALPTREQWDRFRKICVPRRTFDDLDRTTASMLEAFRRLLDEEYEPLTEAVTDALVEVMKADTVEGVITWCNTPSVKRAASGLGLRVIHNELGPLRPPNFRSTVYFDLEGVNGRTTAATRLEANVSELQRTPSFRPFSLGELRDILVTSPAATRQAGALRPEFKAGVALQVEDDSNLVAFGRGYGNLDAIFAARRGLRSEEVLIRHHPAGHARYARHLGCTDDSIDGLAFLLRCERVFTVNSSVAFECLLYERPVVILGDSPAAAFSDRRTAFGEPGLQLLALNWLFLVYLVPDRLLFQADYYRWRLALPPQEAILRRHLASYADQDADAASRPGKAGRLSDAVPPSRFPSFDCVGAVQLFLPRRQGYSEQRSVRRRILEGADQRFSFNFSLDESPGLHPLRLDPAESVGVGEVSDVAVEILPQRRVVWRADATNGFDTVLVGGTAVRLPGKDRLRFLSLGADPVLLFAGCRLKTREDYCLHVTLRFDKRDEAVAEITRDLGGVLTRESRLSREVRRARRLNRRLVLLNSVFRQGALGRDVYVWGTGSAGLGCARMLTRAGCRWSGFVDPQEGKQGLTILGRPVVKPADITGRPAPPFVVIASQFHSAIAIGLRRMGFKRADYLVAPALR
jgi:hypothetical protein